MMCALCGLREAAVFMRRSRPGSSASQALCETCARSRGINASQGRLELRIEELLEPARGEKPVAQACPVCGLTLETLRRERRLGCASCAETFRAELSRFRGTAGLPPRPPAEDRSRGAPGIPDPRLAALSTALAEEDYEEAARLRDLLALPRSESAPHEAGGPGPESDVVLWSRGRLERNFSAQPFPGSPRANAGLGAELGSGPLFGLLGLEGFSFAVLGESGRLALAELGLLSPSFAARSDARVIAARRLPAEQPMRRGSAAGSGELGADPVSRALLAVFDDENHLSLRMELPGLRIVETENSLLAYGSRLETTFSPAYDSELGYLCSSLDACGRGLRLSILFHLPALERAGLLEKALKALLGRGFALRGRYGRSEASSGDLYELSGEAPAIVTKGEELAEAALLLLKAERHARIQIMGEAREELVDRVGRALGTALYARRLSEAEAMELLSDLRLGALCGLLRGLDVTELGRLLMCMGPAWLGREAETRRLSPAASGATGQARDTGELRPPGGAARESLRARLIRDLAAAAALEESA